MEDDYSDNALDDDDDDDDDDNDDDDDDDESDESDEPAHKHQSKKRAVKK